MILIDAIKPYVEKKNKIFFIYSTVFSFDFRFAGGSKNIIPQKYEKINIISNFFLEKINMKS